MYSIPSRRRVERGVAVASDRVVCVANRLELFRVQDEGTFWGAPRERRTSRPAIWRSILIWCCSAPGPPSRFGRGRGADSSSEKHLHTSNGPSGGDDMDLLLWKEELVEDL